MRRFQLWRLLPGAALILLAASPSLALTLGRAQGLALIGRPLDVTVPVVLDSDRDAADLCPRASVFYGESRVDARQVDLLPPNGNAVTIRVRASRPIDEAFITVQVQVGCIQTLSREFVLLTEQPGDVAAAAAQTAPVAPTLLPAPKALPVIDPPPVVEPPRVAAAALPAAAPPAVKTAAPVRARSPARAAVAEPPVARATRPVTRAPRPAPAKRATVERPRLKLDAPVIRPQTPAALKPSPTLQPPATGTAAQRTEAAAQWQALNTQPDDLLRNAQRMVALEADFRAMRETMLRNEAMLGELRNRLQQAERERYSNGLVYSLAGLLAAACALAALLWLRGRRAAAAQARWWADRSGPSEPQFDDHTSTLAHRESPPRSDPMPDRPVAVEPVLIPPRAPAPIEASEARADSAQPEPVDVDVNSVLTPAFASSGTEGPGVGDATFGIEELSDTQQQAEFFLSLGEHERAISVLRELIDANPHASAVPWLQLLDIYHRLQRPNEYEQLRRDYEWLFGAEVAAFDNYDESQPGLEGHPDALSRIQSLWGTPEVLAYFEEALLRRSGRSEHESFGLEDLRDLLMLYGVASDPTDAAITSGPARVIASSASGASSGFGSGLLELGELHVDPHPSDEWKKLAPANARPLGLDVNLDDLDLPPVTRPGGASVPLAGTAGDPNVLDFDLDLTDEFKLPKR